MNSFGIIGCIGFLVLCLTAIVNLRRKKELLHLDFLSRITLMLVLFCTIGGFSALFSLLFMSSIRAWDRASIYIAFLCITASLIMLNYWVGRSNFFRQHVLAIWPLAIVLVAISLYDQTIPVCKTCLIKNAQDLKSDANFVALIEKNVPPGSGIYELPYDGFPEMGPVNQLPAYRLFTGYLHSSKLKWSFGGMQGRPGDLFYRALSKEPIAKQVGVIKNLGFRGIYLDRRGFKDHGKIIDAELTQLVGPSIINSDDGHLSFYKLSYKSEPHSLEMSQRKELSDKFANKK